MRDNKPIELEAENYVCSKLAKINLKYAKPNYDLNGGDIIVINEIDKDTYKSINVQVKGRDITSNNSNVQIHKSYLRSNFVFFLYLKIKDDLNDYLFCFFNNEISNWELKKSYYYLNIPKNTITNSLFNKYRFTKEKVLKIQNILKQQQERQRLENTNWNLTLLDNNIRLWGTTKCLPDHNLTSWFLKNTNLNYSLISQNVFLTCLAFIHSDKLKTTSAVDYMFSLFKHYELQIDENISDIKVVKSYRNDWLITYSNSQVDLIELKYNGTLHNALKLTFGDTEEQVESILIDNGELILSYNKK